MRLLHGGADAGQSPPHGGLLGEARVPLPGGVQGVGVLPLSKMCQHAREQGMKNELEKEAQTCREAEVGFLRRCSQIPSLMHLCMQALTERLRQELSGAEVARVGSAIESAFACGEQESAEELKVGRLNTYHCTRRAVRTAGRPQ